MPGKTMHTYEAICILEVFYKQPNQLWPAVSNIVEESLPKHGERRGGENSCAHFPREDRDSFYYPDPREEKRIAGIRPQTINLG